MSEGISQPSGLLRGEMALTELDNQNTIQAPVPNDTQKLQEGGHKILKVTWKYGHTWGAAVVLERRMSSTGVHKQIQRPLRLFSVFTANTSAEGRTWERGIVNGRHWHGLGNR